MHINLQNTQVMVHCSAGLSRSASIVVAFMMKHETLSLAQAVDKVQKARGRKLQINPSFWMNLALWERELHNLPPKTTPSFDFTNYWLEDFGRMGFEPDKICRSLVEAGDWVHFESAYNALLG